jgi:hypothetical protein
MIDRFNFYDIYGYLLPGTLLLGLFWLPFGLATECLPTKEISTTLLLLAMAYIAGHVLQTIALVVLPSKVLDEKGNRRAPSSILLDSDNPKFGSSFKGDLARKVQSAFNVEILGEDAGRLANRDTAFFQARAYLIRNKAANYVEQFEGLYAMMRGLGCAFFIGCAYLIGWGLSFHWTLWGLGLTVWCVLVASITGALISTAVAGYIGSHPASDRQRKERQQKREKAANSWLAVCILIFVSGLGYFLGTWKPAPGRTEFFLWVVPPLTLIAGIRCIQAYRSYAQNFAETVWRDFSGFYRVDATSPSEKVNGED